MICNIYPNHEAEVPAGQTLYWLWPPTGLVAVRDWVKFQLHKKRENMLKNLSCINTMMLQYSSNAKLSVASDA